MAANLIIYDLSIRIDDITKKDLPNFSKLKLSPFDWDCITIATEKALTDCGSPKI